MRLEEVYCRDAVALEPENKEKIPISNDAHAVCMMLQLLVDKIERVRTG